MKKIQYIISLLFVLVMCCLSSCGPSQDPNSCYPNCPGTSGGTSTGTNGTSSTGTSGTSTGTTGVTEYPSKTLNVPYYQQQTTVWCWLATIEMVAGYYGKNYQQCELASYAMNYQCCYNFQVCAYPASNDYMTLLMQRLGLHGIQYNRGLSESEIINAIDNGQPIIAGSTNWMTQSGHVVVIAGYQKTNQGIQYQVLDPFTYVSYKDYNHVIRNESGGVWSVSWVFNDSSRMKGN